MQIQPILGYFRAIFGLYQPPGLPFLHILDPPLLIPIVFLYEKLSILELAFRKKKNIIRLLSTEDSISAMSLLGHFDLV